MFCNCVFNITFLVSVLSHWKEKIPRINFFATLNEDKEQKTCFHAFYVEFSIFRYFQFSANSVLPPSAFAILSLSKGNDCDARNRVITKTLIRHKILFKSVAHIPLPLCTEMYLLYVYLRCVQLFNSIDFWSMLLWRASCSQIQTNIVPCSPHFEHDKSLPHYFGNYFENNLIKTD